MYVVFALMSVAGAWVAWRHNPLYSVKSTVRVLAATVLLIAAAVCIIIGTIDLTSGRSETVQLIALLGVVIVLTNGMVFSIQAISVPKAARLETVPASTKILNFHRRSVYKWAEFSAAFLAVCGLILIFVPGNAKYALAGAAVIGLLLSLVLLPVMYVMARKFDCALTALELNPWVRWQYSAAQWQQWTGIQVERLKEMPLTFTLTHDFKKLGWAFASIIGGVLIFSPGSLLEKTLYSLFCCVALLLWAELAAWDARRAPEKFRAKLRKVAPEAYFGDDGLFCNGVFVTWLDISMYLTSASIDPRPPRSLLFCFDKLVPNSYGPTQAIPINQAVLIPAGGEADLLRLQKELTERCPQARIALA
jgi:hypothetical protein